jgi:predicted nucleic acid-binding protein
MKALLDTNIVIHRETYRVMNQEIGTLFKWLDKAKYTKYIHPITIQELNKNANEKTKDIFNAKLLCYEQLPTIAPLQKEIENVSLKIDVTDNDKNDTLLLNEVFSGRVDILISEDKKIHQKAELLNIDNKVFTIDSFLEMVVSEHPELINYDVLAVKQDYFGNINLDDHFFGSLKEDYIGFDNWFKKKANEKVYVTYNDTKLLSFLFIKVESKEENYHDIIPVFKPKKRLKIGTFKVVSNGVRLGERFLKIIFDNAVANNVEEIYVTIYDKREEQRRLISLLEEWGFYKYGIKGENGEFVYVRNLSKIFNIDFPKLTFPFIPTDTNIFLVPIYPKYHTELLPDSYLSNESPKNYIENEPHRNALSKIYVSRSINRDVQKGDVIIFYRTANNGNAYYTSVITTIGIVEENINNIKTESEFIEKSRKRSIFTEEYLKELWNWRSYSKPFLIKFLSVYSIPKGNRINRKGLLDLGILSGEENELRGLKQISKDKFLTILKEIKINDRFIVY